MSHATNDSFCLLSAYYGTVGTQQGIKQTSHPPYSLSWSWHSCGMLGLDRRMMKEEMAFVTPPGFSLIRGTEQRVYLIPEIFKREGLRFSHLWIFVTLLKILDTQRSDSS